ncbi:NDR1/HIN1-like protein 3 [Rutidosis leptorrhynchoides]|uniref:NDR1/HIN1-like protein 3 n=1 Tax=Rutidosis leptorrhynchoides TaxID=125765 RepID=UPI003A9A2942
MSPSPEQPHLNGAFYGPPIHQKTKSSYRPGSRGGSCNPLTCCFSCICSCIFNLIFQILITIAIFVGIIALIFWFIFRPNVPNFHVDDVSLTQFTLADNNNTLYYNLAVNMTFRNPNRRLGIYYDKIEANAMYHDQRLSTAEIEGFYLGHKKENNNMSTVFKGEQIVVFKSNEKLKYESENKDEVYKIDLKLRLKIRFKVWWMKTPKFKPKLECELKVPLSGKGKVNSVKFERTNCDFDW